MVLYLLFRMKIDSDEKTLGFSHFFKYFDKYGECRK